MTSAERGAESALEFAPPRADPAGDAACARCGAAFARRDYRDLHVGRAHADLAPAERAAFDAALEAEEAWLREFRRHVRGTLAVLPIFLTLVVIILMGYLGGVPIFLSFLLVPGSAAMAAVLYYMQYTKPEPPGAG